MARPRHLACGLLLALACGVGAAPVTDAVAVAAPRAALRASAVLQQQRRELNDAAAAREAGAIEAHAAALAPALSAADDTSSVAARFAAAGRGLQGAASPTPDASPSPGSFPNVPTSIDGHQLPSWFSVVLSGSLILVGLFEAFLGYKFFRSTLFVVGFLAAGLAVFLPTWDHLPVDNTEAMWIGVGLGTFAGLLVGTLGAVLPRIGVFFVGAGLGVVGGLVLNTLVLYKIALAQHISSNVTLGVACGLLGLVAGGLSTCMMRTMVILATSIIGSYATIRGIGGFAGNYPDEFALSNELIHGQVETVPWQTYAYLGGWAGMSVIAIFVQVCVTARKKNKSKKDEWEEEFDVSSISFDEMRRGATRLRGGKGAKGGALTGPQRKSLRGGKDAKGSKASKDARRIKSKWATKLADIHDGVDDFDVDDEEVGLVLKKSSRKGGRRDEEEESVTRGGRRGRRGEDENPWEAEAEAAARKGGKAKKKGGFLSSLFSKGKKGTASGKGKKSSAAQALLYEYDDRGGDWDEEAGRPAFTGGSGHGAWAGGDARDEDGYGYRGFDEDSVASSTKRSKKSSGGKSKKSSGKSGKSKKSSSQLNW